MEDNTAKTTRPAFAGSPAAREVLRVHAAERGFELGYNTGTGCLEVAVGTARYSARIDLDIDEDGAIGATLFVGGETVEKFPKRMRRARELEYYVDSMLHRYAEAFAPAEAEHAYDEDHVASQLTQAGYDPEASRRIASQAPSAEAAFERAVRELGR